MRTEADAYDRRHKWAVRMLAEARSLIASVDLNRLNLDIATETAGMFDMSRNGTARWPDNERPRSR